MNLLNECGVRFPVVQTSVPQNEAELQLYRVMQRASLLGYYDTLLEMGKRTTKDTSKDAKHFNAQPQIPEKYFNLGNILRNNSRSLNAQFEVLRVEIVEEIKILK